MLGQHYKPLRMQLWSNSKIYIYNEDTGEKLCYAINQKIIPYYCKSQGLNLGIDFN